MLGFVGSPWTLATYVVEGASSGLYKRIKTMIHANPQLLDALLSHLATAIGDYSNFQIASGAHCIQLFDSWGGQLPPEASHRLAQAAGPAPSKAHAGLCKFVVSGSQHAHTPHYCSFGIHRDIDVGCLRRYGTNGRGRTLRG